MARKPSYTKEQAENYLMKNCSNCYYLDEFMNPDGYTSVYEYAVAHELSYCEFDSFYMTCWYLGFEMKYETVLDITESLWEVEEIDIHDLGTFSDRLTRQDKAVADLNEWLTSNEKQEIHFQYFKDWIAFVRFFGFFVQYDTAMRCVYALLNEGIRIEDYPVIDERLSA